MNQLSASDQHFSSAPTRHYLVAVFTADTVGCGPFTVDSTTISWVRQRGGRLVRISLLGILHGQSDT